MTVMWMAMVMRTTVLVLPEVPSQLIQYMLTCLMKEKRRTYAVMFVTMTVTMAMAMIRLMTGLVFVTVVMIVVVITASCSEPEESRDGRRGGRP